MIYLKINDIRLLIEVKFCTLNAVLNDHYFLLPALPKTVT